MPLVKDLGYVSTRDDRKPVDTINGWQVMCWMCGMKILATYVEDLKSLCYYCQRNYETAVVTIEHDRAREKLQQMKDSGRYLE